MDKFTTLYHLLLLLFFLVLPRLPASSSPELDNEIEMQDLVLERVGHVPGEGLYACFTRGGGAAPDPTLHYSATYSHGAANTPTTCKGEISQRAGAADGSLVYCLPPCPAGVETSHLRPISLLVTGHHSTTSETTAALLETFTLPNATPAVIQPGRDVLEVQWAAQPGRAYRVQLWHHPQNTGEVTTAGVQEESSAGVVNDEEGVELSKTSHGEGSEAGEVDVSDQAETEKINDGGETETEAQYAKEEMDKATINEKVPIEKEFLEESVGGSLRQEAATVRKKSTSGLMEQDNLMKVKQCYRDLDTDSDEEDDDDYDDDDDDDHEDDNDDFLKWKRWRSCVALHSPDAPATPAAAILLHTSGTVSCLGDTCLYYVTNLPASGSVSAEITDVTDAVTVSSHTAPTAVQQWGNLTISTVVVASEGAGTEPKSKAVTVTWSDESQGQGEPSKATVEAEGKAEALEVGSTEGDFHAVIINGHSNSEVLRSLPGECNVLGGTCTVRTLETLIDPEGQGPVSNLRLLLSSHHTGASALVSITDVQVRVKKVAPNTVVVLWDRDPHVQEFAVRVVAESGASSDTVIVACSKRGTDCLATFTSLECGNYRAEVTYEKEARVVLSASFTVEDMVECREPFSEVGGRCVLAVTEVTGTWHEMNNHCNQIGGHLLTINTDNFHYHIAKYLKDNGLTGHNYWIGANNDHLGGQYQWLDGTPVKMGTPFWDTVQDVQEPSGGENEHCAGLHGLHQFFIRGFSCQLSLPAICESTGASTGVPPASQGNVP